MLDELLNVIVMEIHPSKSLDYDLDVRSQIGMIPKEYIFYMHTAFLIS